MKEYLLLGRGTGMEYLMSVIRKWNGTFTVMYKELRWNIYSYV